VGSHGNGGLRGSGSASAGTTVLRVRKLREDWASRGRQQEALAGGGACGLAARKAHLAEALHLSMLAPRGTDPTTTAEPHLPPCTSRWRPSLLPGALHHRVRGTGPRPCTQSLIGRSKWCPRPPPPQNRTLLPPPRTRTLRRPYAERWLRLVIVTVSMLPWSVPLWMDDSTP
jgi:hypothetical protein